MSISQVDLLESPVVDRKMRAVLTSWKDIARYVGKSVRSVQRWEKELGLPVRRTKPGEKGVVLAMPGEIDAWVQSQQFTDEQLDPVESERAALFLTLRELRSRNRELRSENLELRSENLELRRQLAIERVNRPKIA
jgi:hypothetical protein